jgi:hypothetical protein
MPIVANYLWIVLIYVAPTLLLWFIFVRILHFVYSKRPNLKLKFLVFSLYKFNRILRLVMFFAAVLLFILYGIFIILGVLAATFYL